MRRYWRADVPLRCGVKEFLGWAALLWAAPQRGAKSWRRICSEGGYTRRMLERLARRKLDCTLAAAARDPERVERAFAAWVAERSDGSAEQGRGA